RLRREVLYRREAAAHQGGPGEGLEETTMALKRVALEIGMGTDIRGGDYTKAAIRALRDALWHNSLTVATAVGKSSDDMQVEVLIGVPQPDKVDKAEVLKVLPHGTARGRGGRGAPRARTKPARTRRGSPRRPPA